MILNDSVNDLLNKVFEKTEKKVELIPVKSMATMAEVKIGRSNSKDHKIYYNSESPEEVNHLIACKCVQILRMYEIIENKRLIAIASQENMNNAKMQIEAEAGVKPELREVLNNSELVSSWIFGLINQLISQPADLLIEKVIYDDYPNLRIWQKNILEKQFRDYLMTLNPKVRDLSPTIVFDASAIMNYVYLRILDENLHTNFTERTEQVYKRKKSQLLYEYTITKRFDSLVSDRDLIDYWADFLKIRSWYDWTSFENVPSEYSK